MSLNRHASSYLIINWSLCCFVKAFPRRKYFKKKFFNIYAVTISYILYAVQANLSLSSAAQGSQKVALK